MHHKASNLFVLTDKKGLIWGMEDGRGVAGSRRYTAGILTQTSLDPSTSRGSQRNHEHRLHHVAIPAAKHNTSSGVPE